MYRDFGRSDEDEVLGEVGNQRVHQLCRRAGNLFDHHFIPNKHEFPAGPSSTEGPGDDILRFYSRTLVCSLEECDEEHEDDPKASPYGGCFGLLCKCPSSLNDLRRTRPNSWPDASFRSLLRFNGLMPFEASMMFTNWDGLKPGMVACEEYMDFKLVDTARRLGWELPARERAKSPTMAEVAFSSLTVDTADRRRGRTQSSSKTPAARRLAYNDEESLQLVASVGRNRETQGTTVTEVRVRDWAPIAKDAGVTEQQACDMWKILTLWYSVTRHLIRRPS